jgi:hypothetical protein
MKKIMKKEKLSEKEELEILRNLLFKIGNAQIGVMKDGGEHLGKILSEIRYGYCYNQSNSYEGQSFEEIEQLRIKSLKRLEEI